MQYIFVLILLMQGITSFRYDRTNIVYPQTTCNLINITSGVQVTGNPHYNRQSRNAPACGGVISVNYNAAKT